MSHFGESSAHERLLEPRDVLGGGMGELDERISSFMGAMASPTRIRVLFALLESEGELGSGELAKAIGMSPSATSHQLRVLRDLGLVKRSRDGRRSLYSLADEHLGVVLRESLFHVDHTRLNRTV